jgi:hypothetical protein
VLLGYGQRCGQTGALGTRGDLAAWLRGAGIAEIEIGPGPEAGFVVFSGRKLSSAAG